jgi:RNA polymerase sigma-54 factor
VTRMELCNEVRPGLVLTPGMRLSLKFLQVSTLELRDLLTRELEANPVLELADDDTAGNEQDQDPGEAEATAPEPGSPESVLEDDPGPTAGVLEWAETHEDEPALPRGTLEARQAVEWEPVPLPEASPSLWEYLLPQLRISVRDRDLLGAGEYLIGCLDERGYLGCSLEEAAEGAGASPALMARALAAIQALDPPGIGARDLRECLLLQLQTRGRRGSPAWRMVEERFDLLSRRSPWGLRRALGLSEGAVIQGLAEIRRLRPHPGRLVAGPEVRYIYPDLIVERVDQGYEVYTNERAVPRLKISGSCRGVLDADGKDEEARRYALTRLRSARWLIQAMDRRRRTMLRVMQCILDQQVAFFDDGPARLRPMTLAQVAGPLGLHESTIARVIRDKYVQTPRGIFPLKFFFSSRLPTITGEDASSRAVRDQIRELIEQEDHGQPLSDKAVAGILGRSGIRIARRTVAKYRNSLRIESAPLRRRRPADPLTIG